MNDNVRNIMAKKNWLLMNSVTKDIRDKAVAIITKRSLAQPIEGLLDELQDLVGAYLFLVDESKSKSKVEWPID